MNAATAGDEISGSRGYVTSCCTQNRPTRDAPQERIASAVELWCLIACEPPTDPEVHPVVRQPGTLVLRRAFAGDTNAHMSVHTPNTDDSSSIARERVTLAHSTVRFEAGPAGTVARVDHDDGTVDYAGPLTDATIDALRAVSR